jgi:hypothetical protein
MRAKTSPRSARPYTPETGEGPKGLGVWFITDRASGQWQMKTPAAVVTGGRNCR